MENNREEGRRDDEQGELGRQIVGLEALEDLVGSLQTR